MWYITGNRKIPIIRIVKPGDNEGKSFKEEGDED
jgi:hypothetical protein